LNAAFISKTDTAEQSLSGYLKLGGKLTLKTGGSAISDDFNASYMQIDPQGSHLALYDGANNMKLSVYASNGAKSTYLTTSDTSNVGILDTQGVARLEISNNSNVPILLGGSTGVGRIPTTYKLEVAGDILSSSGWVRTTGDAGWYSETYGGGIYMVDTTWVRVYANKSFYLNSGILRTDGSLHVGNNGATLAVTSGGNFVFDTNVLFASGSNNRVGIGTATPAYTLDVAGTLNASGTISAIGAGDITLDATDSSTATLTIKKAGSTIGTIGTNTLGGQKISHFVFNSAGTQSRSLNLTYYDGNATKGGLIELPTLLSWSSGTAAMDLNDSDIIGVNSIYFYGTSEPNEGLYFLKYGKTSDSQTLADYNVMRVDGNGTGYIGGNIISTDNVGGAITITRDSNGMIYTVTDTPASGTATTATVTARDANGRISVATEVINGVTLTYTVTRDSLTGKVVSITRT
jgi:hypothetical protein